MRHVLIKFQTPEELMSPLSDFEAVLLSGLYVQAESITNSYMLYVKEKVTKLNDGRVLWEYGKKDNWIMFGSMDAFLSCFSKHVLAPAESERLTAMFKGDTHGMLPYIKQFKQEVKRVESAR